MKKAHEIPFWFQIFLWFLRINIILTHNSFKGVLGMKRIRNPYAEEDSELVRIWACWGYVWIIASDTIWRRCRNFCRLVLEWKKNLWNYLQILKQILKEKLLFWSGYKIFVLVFYWIVQEMSFITMAACLFLLTFCLNKFKGF